MIGMKTDSGEISDVIPIHNEHYQINYTNGEKEEVFPWEHFGRKKTAQ